MDSSQFWPPNPFHDYMEDTTLSIIISKNDSNEVINLLIQNNIPFSCVQRKEVRNKNIVKNKSQELIPNKASVKIESLTKDDDLETAIKALHQQITAHISVEIPAIEVITNRLNVSPAKFKSVFKEMYQTPFHQYFMRYKMEQAKQLLESGRYSVKQISEVLGYTTPIKFVIVFKKYQKVTPGKIKTLAKNQYS
jgi:AraC-like DNA-binding protein